MIPPAAKILEIIKNDLRENHIQLLWDGETPIGVADYEWAVRISNEDTNGIEETGRVYSFLALDFNDALRGWEHLSELLNMELPESTPNFSKVNRNIPIYLSIRFIKWD